MQLLWPDGELVGIAVEGLSPRDQAGASAETVDIADLTLYYGGVPTFEQAARTRIVQFKYSIADRNTGFRASQARIVNPEFQPIVFTDADEGQVQVIAEFVEVLTKLV